MFLLKGILVALAASAVSAISSQSFSWKNVRIGGTQSPTFTSFLLGISERLGLIVCLFSRRRWFYPRHYIQSV